METDYFLPLHQKFIGKSPEEILEFLSEKNLLNNDGLEKREELVERLKQLKLPTVAEKKNKDEMKKLDCFRQNVGLLTTEIIFYFQTKDKTVLAKKNIRQDYRKTGFESVERIS